MNPPQTTPSETPAVQRLPRRLIIGSTVAVVAVNLLILGYAMYLQAPTTASRVSKSTPTATSQNSASRLSNVVSTNLTSIAVTIPVSGAAPDTTGNFDDSDDDDWAFEPIVVVNELNLPSLDEIRPAYTMHCATCHGDDGRGNGPVADQLLPMPRDFVGSVFRYATTGSDRAHIITDLERTITQGTPRSAMPGFGGVLPEREIAGLARYVLDLRENGDEQPAPADYIGLGVRPPNTPELVAQGAKLYTNLACNSCHGDSGRGDGPNALALRDFQGKPVRPADFTTGLFKSGQAPEDLCRTALRGIPGTPMVAYEMMLSKDNDDDTVNTIDAWALVAYIRSFAPRVRPMGTASGAVFKAVEAPSQAMLTDPSHLAWLGVEPITVSVNPLQQRPEQTTNVTVRVVRTDDQLAICLDWRDDTPDFLRGDGIYPDAASVAFGLGEDVPALPIGVDADSSREDGAVNLWRWRADRQYRQTVGQHLASATTGHSSGASSSDDWYLFVPGSNARVPQASDPDGTIPAPQQNKERQDGSDLNAIVVLEADWGKDGGPSVQSVDGQNTTGTAAWANGLWRIVMVRDLETEDKADVQFESSERLPISFAIWNGSKGDHDEVKLISSWHWISVRR